MTVAPNESAVPSAPVWQHYPQPPAASAPSPEAQSAAANSSQGASRYPPVPGPADKLWTQENHMSSSASTAPPTAAAVGAAAVTLAAAGGATISPAQVGNPELKVVVHNPLKHTGPTGIPGLEEAYISYEVTTITSMPHFSAQRITVRRRFRDFVSLANLLPKLLHGRCARASVLHQTWLHLSKSVCGHRASWITWTFIVYKTVTPFCLGC